MKIVNLHQWLASRPRRRKCSTIVMHATAGSTLIGAIEALKQRGFSYHYLIEKSGTITKCVPYKEVAYHAGVSIGPQGPMVNSYSIGISFVNKNDGKDPYPEDQLLASRYLIYQLLLAMPNIKWLTTHRQISWPRKNDPVGLGVYLREFAKEAGMQYWYSPSVPES